MRLRALITASFLALSIVPWFAAPAPAATAASNSPATVRAYARVLRKFNPALPSWQSTNLAKHLLINASRWRLNANILVALVSVESAWHTHAMSSAGAIGLGQLMPGTAATLHVNPRDPYQNLQGAARYLGGLLRKYRNSPSRYQLAFAAYNAGPKAVAAYGGIPPYAETQHYVVKVMRAWRKVSRTLRAPAPLRATATASQVEVLYGSPDTKYWVAPK